MDLMRAIVNVSVEQASAAANDRLCLIQIFMTTLTQERLLKSKFNVLGIHLAVRNEFLNAIKGF